MADDIHDVLGTLLIASGCAEGEHDIGPSFFPFPPSFPRFPLLSLFCGAPANGTFGLELCRTGQKSEV